jgi:hypothetical protein
MHRAQIKLREKIERGERVRYDDLPIVDKPLDMSRKEKLKLYHERQEGFDIHGMRCTANEFFNFGYLETIHVPYNCAEKLNFFEFERALEKAVLYANPDGVAIAWHSYHSTIPKTGPQGDVPREEGLKEIKQHNLFPKNVMVLEKPPKREKPYQNWARHNIVEPLMAAMDNPEIGLEWHEVVKWRTGQVWTYMRWANELKGNRRFV